MPATPLRTFRKLHQRSIYRAEVQFELSGFFGLVFIDDFGDICKAFGQKTADWRDSIRNHNPCAGGSSPSTATNKINNLDM